MIFWINLSFDTPYVHNNNSNDNKIGINFSDKLHNALQRRVALQKAGKKALQARKDTSGALKSNTMDLNGLGKFIFSSSAKHLNHMLMRPNNIYVALKRPSQKPSYNDGN